MSGYGKRNSKHKSFITNQFGTWVMVSYKIVKLGMKMTNTDELTKKLAELKAENGNKKLTVHHHWDIGLYLAIPERRPATEKEIAKYMEKKRIEAQQKIDREIRKQKYKERQVLARQERKVHVIKVTEKILKNLKSESAIYGKRMERIAKDVEKFEAKLAKLMDALGPTTNVYQLGLVTA